MSGKSFAEQIQFLFKEIFQNKRNVVTPAKGNIDQKSRQPKNYVSLDIEIAKVVPGDFSQWQDHRPLGITCASVQFKGQEPMLWFSKKENGDYAERMSTDDLARMVDYLRAAVQEGWQIVTWNGLGFDFNVLAEESGRWVDCAELAFNHIDMMFHLFCDKGYPLSLEKAAQGMGLPGKSPGMSGELAPVLWQKGEFQKVLNYVSQDARLTLSLALSGENTRHINWMSNRGNPQYLSLPWGWLPVNRACRLPTPDTSWMDKPLKRSDFTQWLFSPPHFSAPRPLKAEKEMPNSDQQTSMLAQNIDTGITPNYIAHRVHPKRISNQELISKSKKVNPVSVTKSRKMHKKVNICCVLECGCPICRGVPDEDLIFKYFVGEGPAEKIYYDDYDDYNW